MLLALACCLYFCTLYMVQVPTFPYFVRKGRFMVTVCPTVLWKLVETFQFWLQLDGSSGCFTLRPSYVSSCILCVTCLYFMKHLLDFNMFQTEVSNLRNLGSSLWCFEDSSLVGYYAVLVYIHQQFRGAWCLSLQGLCRSIRVPSWKNGYMFYVKATALALWHTWQMLLHAGSAIGIAN